MFLDPKAGFVHSDVEFRVHWCAVASCILQLQFRVEGLGTLSRAQQIIGTTILLVFTVFLRWDKVLAFVQIAEAASRSRDGLACIRHSLRGHKS